MGVPAPGEGPASAAPRPMGEPSERLAWAGRRRDRPLADGRARTAISRVKLCYWKLQFSCISVRLRDLSRTRAFNRSAHRQRSDRTPILHHQGAIEVHARHSEWPLAAATTRSGRSEGRYLRARVGALYPTRARSFCPEPAVAERSCCAASVSKYD